MLKFIAVGSGSSGNCYYLTNGTDCLLIDLGVGINALKRCFRKYHIDFDSVDDVLITHDHSDHIKLVGRLSGEYHLPVYATRAVHEGIDRSVEHMRERCLAGPKKRTSGLLQPILPECRRYVEKGVPFMLGAFRITPFGVPHDSSDNVGYAIEYDGIMFCLMTDIGHLTEEMEAYISKADYLVIEANHDRDSVMNGPYPAYLKERILGSTGHLSNKECGQAVAEYASSRLRHIWLCHLSKTNNSPALALSEVKEMIRTTVESVRGRDFMLNVPIDVLERGKMSDLFELAG
ncbi:MAG: MBL fold metallo-hydrolase [Prevotella sp.]|jgi:phosphoribosyl 1,2-cyclic phosphodiesterase|nr:MBL fold metallo-hydrolase [Prevotella sp.]